MKMAKLAVLMVVVGGMLLGAPLGAMAEKKLQVPPVTQKVIVIPGNKAWTNTGFTLQPRDRVTITATGTVYFSGGMAGSRVNPRGWDVSGYEADWPDDYGYCFDPLPTANHAALIGNVGSDVFLVGSKLVFWGADGFLYLGINDCSFTGPYYNTGQFTAVIKVERNVVTLKLKPGVKPTLAGPKPLVRIEKTTK